jgi:tetratricopeptide (TPR) repeat protein
MSFSYLDRGDSFNALKTLQRFKRIQPDSPHMDKVDLAIADSFLRLARYDEAREALKDIESRSKRRSTQAEAAYRLGDVDYRQSRFVEAEKSYIRAADTYPDFRSRFPNAAYNTAEGQFERKEYRAAIDAYVAFMRAFPAHPHTAYALTRVGELLEILSGDQRRAMGAYIENQFRNPSHPGSLVSRIRLLTARFPKFKDKELEAALESVTKAADDLQKDENFIDVKELTTIVIADGLTARGDFERANSLLIGQFQANPQSVHGTKFQSRIAQNLTSQISQAVDKGDWLSALRVHSRNQESWLRSANRIDSEFLAARAYEMAGVMDPAFEAYQRIVDRLAQLQGSDELKAREVFERLPTLIEARTRLAQVQYQRGQFQQAQETLERDSGKESPAVAESLLAERADLSAALAERKGQVDVGIRYLRELIGKWRKDDPSAERLRFRLARLLKESKKAEAMKEADEILSQIVAATPKDKALLADALQMQADLAVEQKQSSKAMSALEALVNLQEADGRAVGSARYRLGLLQFEAGQVKAAEGTWGRLDPTRDRIWKGLAQDQMSSERWRSEYDKYIRRIPAATSLQGGSRE